jgi:hypothetical protein
VTGRLTTVALALSSALIAGVGIWWLVSSAQRDALDDAETTINLRSGRAASLLYELVFAPVLAPPGDPAVVERCDLADDALVPVESGLTSVTGFVVVGGDGGVVCDESATLVDDPAAFGAWVATAGAEYDYRSIAIGPPGTVDAGIIVELLPLEDRWLAVVKLPPLQPSVYSYVGADFGFLVSPDGGVYLGETPPGGPAVPGEALDAPDVAGLGGGEMGRIRVPGFGELLAASDDLSVQEGSGPDARRWRVVVADDLSDVDDQARDRWAPAVTVLAVATILVWALLARTAMLRRRPHR